MAGLYAQAFHRMSRSFHDRPLDGIKAGQQRLIICCNVLVSSLRWVGIAAIELCRQRNKLFLESREAGVWI